MRTLVTRGSFGNPLTIATRGFGIPIISTPQVADWLCLRNDSSENVHKLHLRGY